MYVIRKESMRYSLIKAHKKCMAILGKYIYIYIDNENKLILCCDTRRFALVRFINDSSEVIPEPLDDDTVELLPS